MTPRQRLGLLAVLTVIACVGIHWGAYIAAACFGYAACAAIGTRHPDDVDQLLRRGSGSGEMGE